MFICEFWAPTKCKIRRADIRLLLVNNKVWNSPYKNQCSYLVLYHNSVSFGAWAWPGGISIYETLVLQTRRIHIHVHHMQIQIHRSLSLSGSYPFVGDWTENIEILPQAFGRFTHQPASPTTGRASANRISRRERKKVRSRRDIEIPPGFNMRNARSLLHINHNILRAHNLFIYISTESYT
jgi:hypothetical protein